MAYLPEAEDEFDEPKDDALSMASIGAMAIDSGNKATRKEHQWRSTRMTPERERVAADKKIREMVERGLHRFTGSAIVGKVDKAVTTESEKPEGFTQKVSEGALEKVSARRPGITHSAPPIPLDYERIENLRAEGMTIEEISLKLGHALSTLNNRRGSDKRLNDALNTGLERHAAKPGQDSVKERTPEQTETAKPIRTQPIQLDIEQDTIARFSPSNEVKNQAAVSVLAELRAERDELNRMITFLEKRCVGG